jgi:hypothetical protein
MANVFLRKNRYVVPNFRRFRDTVALGELRPASATIPTPHKIDFETRIAEWKVDPNVGLAGDILSAAMVAPSDNNPPEVAAAAQFILNHEDVSSPSLTSAARLVLKQDSCGSHTTFLPRLRTFLEHNSRQAVFNAIHHLRSAISRFGSDPILFTELARLYLIVGDELKARRHIGVAHR